MNKNQVSDSALSAWVDFDPLESWPLLEAGEISRIRHAFLCGWQAAYHNWRLIDSAPRSDDPSQNKPILVLQDGRRFIAEWDPDAGHWSGIYALDGIETEKYFQEWPGRLYGVTHWAGIPEVPLEILE